MLTSFSSGEDDEEQSQMTGKPKQTKFQWNLQEFQSKGIVFHKNDKDNCDSELNNEEQIYQRLTMEWNSNASHFNKEQVSKW